MAPSRKTHSRRKTVRGPPIIAYHTEDVLINILSRLPVKSILRFKCVSKTWQSLISDPYLQRILPTIMSGLFYTFFERNVGRCKYKFIPNRSLPNTNNVSIKDVDDLSFFPHHQHEFCILNCCNGLLLVQALESTTSNIRAYYVINPATKKWAALPHGPKEHIRTNFMLAFDSLVSPHYTLICWGCLFLGVDIFSSKTGMWVHFKVPLELVTQPQRLLSAFPAVLLNRTLHMLSEHDSIVGFDLDEECFRLIPLPGATQRNLQKCLGVSGGYLYYANHDSSQLQIWMLEDYDEHKWVLKHQTTINSLVQKRQLIHFLCFHHECSGFSEYYRNNFRLFAFHPDFELLFLEMGGTLFSYHLNSTKLEKVWGLNPMYNGTHYQQSIYWQSIYPFSPCLENFYDRKWC